MSKAILVLNEMPNTCKECNIMVSDDYSDWCPYDNPEPNGVWRYVESGTKPDWCPLFSIPKKRKPSYDWDEYEDGWDDGWNSCVEYLENQGIQEEFDKGDDNEMAD